MGDAGLVKEGDGLEEVCSNRPRLALGETLIGLLLKVLLEHDAGHELHYE